MNIVTLKTMDRFEKEGSHTTWFSFWGIHFRSFYLLLLLLHKVHLFLSFLCSFRCWNVNHDDEWLISLFNLVPEGSPVFINLRFVFCNFSVITCSFIVLIWLLDLIVGLTLWLNEYSPIGMCCGVPKSESSRTDDVVHHAIALVWHTRCSIKCFTIME